jgi:pectinesterase
VTNKTTMMLSCRVVVIVLFVLVVVMMIEVELAECGNGGVRNYISWEDLMVDEQRFVFKKNINHNEVRVIVVDQNGNGHSKTVQGAVDLVPDWNQHRVKIYIFPGIYRFVITN